MSGSFHPSPRIQALTFLFSYFFSFLQTPPKSTCIPSAMNAFPHVLLKLFPSLLRDFVPMEYFPGTPSLPNLCAIYFQYFPMHFTVLFFFLALITI